MAALNPLRWSLVAVWLITAVVSLLELNGQSADLLWRAGLRHPFLIDTLIWAGAALDVVLGLALWWVPRRSTYGMALASLGLMTLVASVLSPSLWLHPLGPLLKNIPIAAALCTLIRAEKP